MYRRIDILYAYTIALHDHLKLAKLYRKYGMPNLARFNRGKVKEFIKLIRRHKKKSLPASHSS